MQVMVFNVSHRNGIFNISLGFLSCCVRKGILLEISGAANLKWRALQNW